MELFGMETVGSPALWLGFIALVLGMLVLDLGVFHRKAHEVSIKEAAVWSVIWIGLAGVFAIAVNAWFGPERALEFATGYLIEKALAVDNIFVFVVIFSTFAIPAAYQHRVLFWGILGALIMRAAFIFAGGAFLQKFHWAMYLFGALLIATGVKLLLQRNKEPHPERNPVVRAFQRIFPVTSAHHGSRFTVVQDGKRFATPLLVALLTVEITDVVFAVDSIPAIFAVTTDPFIVFTSNIFAILGLRSLYFLLASVVTKFRYLTVGLSFVLVFVGAKMVLADVYKVPVIASLVAIAIILGASVAASLLRPSPRVPAAPRTVPQPTEVESLP
jgi:tellurite resistance protein TerC